MKFTTVHFPSVNKISKTELMLGFLCHFTNNLTTDASAVRGKDIM
jgi:hypothetical protein